MSDNYCEFDPEKLKMVNDIFSAVVGHTVTFTPGCFQKPASFINCGINRVDEAFEVIKANPDEEYDYSDVENYLAYTLAEEMICDQDTNIPICYGGELDWLLHMIPDNSMLDFCSKQGLNSSSLDSALADAKNRGDKHLSAVIYSMINGVDGGLLYEEAELAKEAEEERE